MTLKERGRRVRVTHPTPAQRAEAEERRLAPMMRALKAIHSASSPESMRPEDLKRQRAAQEVLGRLITPMIGMKWAPFELEGMNAAWVRPERSYDRNHAILYCHGGGYTSGNLGYSRPLASKLSGVTGWDTLSFEYRLAPEHPFPAAVDDAMIWNRVCIDSARSVYFTADLSERGKMVVCTAFCLPVFIVFFLLRIFSAGVSGVCGCDCVDSRQKILRSSGSRCAGAGGWLCLL